MKNNYRPFVEQHPDVKGLILLTAGGWMELFGDDVVVDIAEDRHDAAERVQFYQSLGYRLKDENAFGCGAEMMGVMQCYKKE